MGYYDKAFGGGGRRSSRPTRQQRESARIMAELREKEEDERAARESNTGAIAGAVMSAAIGVTGYMADPGQLPNTGQLNDAHTSQVERYRDSIEDESHGQGTGTSQNN